MKILKFGGTSVGSVESILQVIEIIENYVQNKEKISVVFSAIGGVTDSLIDLSYKALKREDVYLAEFQDLRIKHNEILEALIAQSLKSSEQFKLNKFFEELADILKGIYLLKELTPRILDKILSYGERLSTYIIFETLNNNNIKCEILNASDIIKTNSSYGNASVNFDKTNKNIVEYFSSYKCMQIITGFIGSNDDGDITTLGRGGSDYTASIIGAALNVEEIEIWTDVDGILTADPRKVENSIPLKAVTFQEAMEMSYFGAKVIYPPTMQPAFDKNIKIRIRNTFNPSFKGTVIIQKESNIKFNAKGISSVDNIILLRISGSGLFGNEEITAKIFNVLSKEKIKALLITQGSSGLSICIAVLPKDGNKAKYAITEELKLEIFEKRIKEIEAEENLSIIAVVGEDMRHTPGIAGKVFYSLGKNGINIIAIAQGSSELNISFVIRNEELSKALNVLHNSLFLANRKVLNMFLIGIGLVGKALLKYIDTKMNFLEKELSLKIKFIGIANSKKMLIDKNGINYKYWQDELNRSGTITDIKSFVSVMQNMNLANSILIDCTANESVVPFYLRILDSNISITTPNKIANTKDYAFYQNLREISKRKNVKFLYNTNVGAGMPIISTIKELVNSGDKISKIEGILSGTMSYLFNSFKGDIHFSEILKNAKKNGYTEPDPRDDLNGLDVARKLLILIREIGIKYDLENIEVENLVPISARADISLEDFFEIIKKNDYIFEERKIQAERNGNVLRYMAKYENGNASVKLTEIKKSHPFFNLNGNDNIVAITSENYSLQPLIIRGRGAGANFTASGIFADILKIANHLD